MIKYIISWVVLSIILLLIIASPTGYKKSIFDDSIKNKYNGRKLACPMVPICNVMRKECNGPDGWYDCSTRECKNRKDQNCLTQIYNEKIKEAEESKMSFGDKIKHTLGGKTIYTHIKHGHDDPRQDNVKARTIAFYIISIISVPLIILCLIFYKFN